MTQGAKQKRFGGLNQERLILDEADRMFDTGFIHDIVPAKRGDN